MRGQQLLWFGTFFKSFRYSDAYSCSAEISTGRPKPAHSSIRVAVEMRGVLNSSCAAYMPREPWGSVLPPCVWSWGCQRRRAAAFSLVVGGHGRWGRPHAASEPAAWLICIEPDDQHRRKSEPRESNPLHPRPNFRESRVFQLWVLYWL